jgi:hypothetical protein
MADSPEKIAAKRIIRELEECRRNPRFSRFEETDIEIVAPRGAE